MTVANLARRGPEGRRIHRHLTRAAQDWQALGQEPTELYSGPRLATTTERLERAGPREELNGLLTDFLRASTAREEAAHVASQEQLRARERSHRRLRNLLAATAVALVVALLAGTVAVVQRGRADHEAATARAASLDATADRLVAQSRTLQAENRYLGTLLALEADRIRDQPQTRGAIFGALLEEPRRVLTIPTPTSDAVAPLADGSALVLTGGRVERWDVRRGLRLARFGARTSPRSRWVPTARSRSVGPTGRSPSSTRRADLGARWSAPPERWVRPDAAGPRCQRAPPAPHDLAFSPDGRLLAAVFGTFGDPLTLTGADWVRAYDTSSGRAEPTRFGGHTGSVTTVAFDHTGRLLLTGGNDDRWCCTAWPRAPRSDTPSTRGAWCGRPASIRCHRAWPWPLPLPARR